MESSPFFSSEKRGEGTGWAAPLVGLAWGRGGLGVGVWRRQCQDGVGNSSLHDPLAQPQHPWDLWRGLLTDDVDTDSTAFLGPMARMGGHTAVSSLVLRPYLREEQHGVGGKG